MVCYGVRIVEILFFRTQIQLGVHNSNSFKRYKFFRSIGDVMPRAFINCFVYSEFTLNMIQKTRTLWYVMEWVQKYAIPPI